ncbi:MAG: hypothetical protein ACOC1U_09260 [Spirochaetota bacterium]
MRLFRLVTLAVLATLIAVSAFVGQLAFRMDRTVLRHDFVQRELGTWLEPLSIPANHERFTTALVDEIRRSLGWNVPSQIRVAMHEAAAQTFTPEWTESFVRRAHTAAYRLMRGDPSPVRLPMSLGGFTNRFANLVSAQVPEQQARAVSAQLARVPDSIDLWQSMDEPTQRRVATALRRVPVFSLLLQYALPGLFLALTLVFRRPGSAMISSGAGLTGGAAAMILFTTTSAETTGRTIGGVLRSALPGRPEWIEAPVAASVVRAIASGIGFAALLASIGLVLVIAGGLVVRLWNDRLDPIVGSARELLRES